MVVCCMLKVVLTGFSPIQSRFPVCIEFKEIGILDFVTKIFNKNFGQNRDGVLPPCFSFTQRGLYSSYPYDSQQKFFKPSQRTVFTVVREMWKRCNKFPQTSEEGTRGSSRSSRTRRVPSREQGEFVNAATLSGNSKNSEHLILFSPHAFVS